MQAFELQPRKPSMRALQVTVVDLPQLLLALKLHFSYAARQLVLLLVRDDLRRRMQLIDAEHLHIWVLHASVHASEMELLAARGSC